MKMKSAVFLSMLAGFLMVSICCSRTTEPGSPTT